MNIIKRAQQVLDIEAKSILNLKQNINSDFQRAVQLILRSKGRVVVTGMGKAGIIGQKLSATLSSTGTPSLWVHPAEAIHGDLGRVTKDDIIYVAGSNAGMSNYPLKVLIKRSLDK